MAALFTPGEELTVALGQEFRVGQAPRLGVPGAVELGEHANAACPRVLDDRSHVLEAVGEARVVAALGRELREDGALVREAVVVDDVPVQNVQLVVDHAVQDEQNVGDGQEVAGRVDQKTSVGQSWLIEYFLPSHHKLTEFRYFIFRPLHTCLFFIYNSIYVLSLHFPIERPIVRMSRGLGEFPK